MGFGEPRLGCGYAMAIGASLADWVVIPATLSATPTAADLICDLGTLTRAVTRRIGPGGRVIGCDFDAGVLEVAASTAGGIAAAGGLFQPLRIEPGRIPLADASCDLVVSLLTLGFGNAPALLDEARRVAVAPGRVAILVYDAAAPPAHEALLGAALTSHGQRSAFLERLLAPGIIANAVAKGYTATAIRDVARFDGPGRFWRAMVEERPIARELEPCDAPTVASIQVDVIAGLRPYQAADDTIRIPVTAVLLRA